MGSRTWVYNMKRYLPTFLSLFATLCLSLDSLIAEGAVNPAACSSIDKQIRRSQELIKRLNSRYKSNANRVRRATVLLTNRSKSVSKYLEDVTTRIGVASVELSALLGTPNVAEPYELTVDTIVADPSIIDKLIEMDTVTWKNSTVRGVYLVFGDYANGMGRYYDGCPKGPYSGQAAYVPANWQGCYDCSRPGTISKSTCTLFGQSLHLELDGLFGLKSTASKDILADRESWLNKANNLGLDIFNMAVDRSSKAKEFVGSQQALKLQQAWKDQAQLATTIGEATTYLAKLKETKLSCASR